MSLRWTAAPIDSLPPDVGEPMADGLAVPEGSVGVPGRGPEVPLTEAVSPRPRSARRLPEAAATRPRGDLGDPAPAVTPQVDRRAPPLRR